MASTDKAKHKIKERTQQKIQSWKYTHSYIRDNIHRMRSTGNYSFFHSFFSTSAWEHPAIKVMHEGPIYVKRRKQV